MFNRKKVRCAFNVKDDSKFKADYPDIKIEKTIWIHIDEAWLLIGELFLDECMEMTKKKKADSNLLSFDLLANNSNDSKESSDDEHHVYFSPNVYNF